ncbi:lipoyl(octanoyl) transferase LipB, partial [Eikenella corrodens]|nr:lipoyl(octanoyl) transferase LipB [Eikenella corrodens]
MKVIQLGLAEYSPIFHAMEAFTDARSERTEDELWVVEHPPVFTQGMAGKAEHLLARSNIPVVQIDRGGQITYHGPGQLVVYT